MSCSGMILADDDDDVAVAVAACSPADQSQILPLRSENIFSIPSTPKHFCYLPATSNLETRITLLHGILCVWCELWLVVTAERAVMLLLHIIMK